MSLEVEEQEMGVKDSTVGADTVISDISGLLKRLGSGKMLELVT